MNAAFSFLTLIASSLLVIRVVSTGPMTAFDEQFFVDLSSPTSATLLLNRGSMMTAHSWIGRYPHVDLAPGTWEVTVQAGDAGQYTSDPQTVVVEEGQALGLCSDKGLSLMVVQQQASDLLQWSRNENE